MSKRSIFPPKLPNLARWLLGRTISRDIRYSALGDFEEIYAATVADRGIPQAKLWLWIQVVKSLPLFIADTLYWQFQMLNNYLKVALRKMRRQKTFSVINMAGLAIGMAICILILLWIQDELSYDRFHENADNICRVVLNDQRYGLVWPVISIPVAPALKDNFPEIIDSTRVSDFQGLVTREKKQFDEVGAYVDPSFFEIFSFPFVKGNPNTTLETPSSIVISQRMADKFFGTEDPLGKNLKLNNELNLVVTGVIENMPSNSHLNLDFLVPFGIFERHDRDPTNWGRFQIYSYVLLQENTRSTDIDPKLRGILQQHDVRDGLELELEPLTQIHLYASDGGGDIRYVYIFGIISFFILVIACINFMNLSTARSSMRTKEIGVRKVTGARRVDLIRQFLGESIFFSFVALALAIVLASLFLPAFNNLAGKQLSMNPQGNRNLILGFLGIVIFSGLLAGSYPALFLSSFQPVNILRSALIPTRFGSKKSTLRKALVVVQFTISVFLVIATLVIFKQLRFIQNINLGFQKDHIISIPLRGISVLQHHAFKSEVLWNQKIQGIAATSELPILIGKTRCGYNWEGKDPEKEFCMNEIYVDHDFIETMNMTIVKGRGFSKDFATDSEGAYVINEAAVDAMGIQSPIGKRFFAPTHSGMREGPIIGVVKDFHFRPLHDEIGPLVMFIMPENYRYFCVRVQTNVSRISETIAFLENTWKKFVPNFPFSYRFLDMTFDSLYRSEKKTSQIFSCFTSLAIFISCLGLFGLVAQITEQRTKEIGIRKVMGASELDIALLLSRDFMKWVLTATAIAWPLAYFAMKKWLQNFAYRTSLGIEIFIAAVVLSFAIALATVSFQSIRAAITNPANSLRYE
jgi:putative ABC transport system permease protein